MDGRPDPKAEALGGACHRPSAPHGSGRAVEDRQEPIAGGAHLASAEAVQVVAEADVVAAQEILPGSVAHPLEHGRRVDDVSEEDRRDDPFAGTLRPDAHEVRARPLDRHPRLVTDHPGVMSGRDLEDRIGRDVERLPIVHADMQDAGDRVPEVVDLAAWGAHRGCEIHGPSPAGAPVRPSDGRLGEADDLSVPLGKGADLVGGGEALDLESGHEGALSDQAMRPLSGENATTDLYHVHQIPRPWLSP